MTRAQLAAQGIHDLVHIIDNAEAEFTFPLSRGEPTRGSIRAKTLRRCSADTTQVIRCKIRILRRKFHRNADFPEIRTVRVDFALPQFTRMRERFTDMKRQRLILLSVAIHVERNLRDCTDLTRARDAIRVR